MQYLKIPVAKKLILQASKCVGNMHTLFEFHLLQILIALLSEHLDQISTAKTISP